MPKKAILSIAGAILGSIVLTIALDALFALDPTHQWATAVQASATLILVGVTGVYVWVTYRQMQLQATPLVAIRLAAQEQAARQAVGLLQETRDHGNDLIRNMPALDKSDKPDFEESLKDANALQAPVDALFVLAATLPQQFALQTFRLSSDMLPPITHLYMLSNACSMEGLDAIKDNRKWTLEGARRHYLADIRKPEAGHPEWADLVRLGTLTKCLEELKRLQVEISAYLLSPPGKTTKSAQPPPKASGERIS
jgi:hypothetical protein